MFSWYHTPVPYQSLENWNANDPLSLLKLIKELVTHYKEYQRKQVEDMPRIHFEYTTLAEDSKYPDFEVHVIKGQQVRKMGKFDNNCINLLLGSIWLKVLYLSNFKAAKSV